LSAVFWHASAACKEEGERSRTADLNQATQRISAIPSKRRTSAIGWSVSGAIAVADRPWGCEGYSEGHRHQPGGGGA